MGGLNGSAVRIFATYCFYMLFVNKIMSFLWLKKLSVTVTESVIRLWYSSFNIPDQGQL